jgi:Ca-activated chloride channel family protein
MIIFSTPIYLLLVPFCVMIVWFVLRELVQRRQANAATYSSLAFARSVFGRNLILERFLAALVLFGIAAPAFALSGPKLLVRVPLRDGAVVLCIDTSGSMATPDIVPTRAEGASKAAHLFVQHIPEGVRVGIVSFSTNANTVLPLDTSREVIDQSIERIPNPNGATAIGDALLLAEQTLPKQGQRAVILLTDGVNNRGNDPIAAAQDLALHHITLFTVGIGTHDSGQLVPGTNEAADADPDALRQYAELTGGKFFAVKDAESIASAFLSLTQETAWSTRPIDIALPSAIIGAISLLFGLLAGLFFGRFP